MRRIIGWALIGALAGLVTACTQEAETLDEAPAVEQGGEASGEVLGGSVSDAMIPLESLQSQSPPLRRQTTTTTVTQGPDGRETTVETTTTTTQTGPASEAPAPSPPEPPAAPAQDAPVR